MNTPQEHLYRQFHLVFNTYYNSLCNYAFSFVKDTDASEDIVQELFTRIWEDRRELLMADTIRYYLFTAVRNNSISYLRLEKKKGLMEWKDQEGGFDLMPAEDRGKDMDYRALLGKAIDSLPPKCREVFLLSRISDMTYKEIAASLGISQKTVENQLGKALKILRVLLKDKGVYLAWGMVNFFLQVHGG